MSKGKGKSTPRPARAERFLWQPGDLKRVGDVPDEDKGYGRAGAPEPARPGPKPARAAKKTPATGARPKSKR